MGKGTKASHSPSPEKDLQSPSGHLQTFVVPHTSAKHPTLQGQKLRLTKAKGYTQAHNYAPVDQWEQLCLSPQR